LRDSEVAALIEIAKFRTVKTEDLVEIQYQGNTDRATQDLRNLTAQGLIQRRTLPGTQKEQLLTVTRSAHAFLDRNRPQGLAANQSLHHGFVKPREARHDATLYRLYQKVSGKIEQNGGTKLRVVLDYELKRDLYRELAKLKSLPLSEQEARRDQIAQEHGLKVVDGKVPLPDLRIEYETRDHDQARVDLELATRDYRGHHLAEKGKAGFSIYAAADDASRVRAAVQDPHLISEILSL
jgi:DNA-binding MarR family transcriptional regulator